MTRPVTNNGLGLSAAETDREVQAIEAGMSLLAENAAVYREWRKIVVKHNVSGVRVHDARLAAAMHVHGITHILTLNVGDFGRFAGSSHCIQIASRCQTRAGERSVTGLKPVFPGFDNNPRKFPGLIKA